MTLNVGTLVLASDEEFGRHLKWNLRRPEWEMFMEPEVIDRTQETLGRIIASISTQLAEHSDNGDPEWLRRAKTLLALVSGRKGEVNRAIKDLNRTEALEVDTWRAFAAKLANILEEAGARAVLDRLDIPGGDDIKAGEWLDRRRARLAAKAAA